MSNVNTSVTYSLDTSGGIADNDFLWLEQEEEKETMTLGEAASMIDSIYDLNPCDASEQVLTTPIEGEDLGTFTAPPYETDYDTEAYAKFINYAQTQMNLYICSTQPANLTIDIPFKVVRGNIDIPYELKIPETMIVSTRTVTTIIEETLTVTGSKGAQLRYPVVIRNPLTDVFGAGWLGTPEVEAGKSNDITRNGNSLSWEGETYGSIRVRYSTRYDVVTVRAPYAESAASAKYHVVAFYNRMAAETDLDKPVPEGDDVDTSIYCAPFIDPNSGDLDGGDDDGDGSPTCTAEVTSVAYCNCSGEEASRSEPTEQSVECPSYIKSGSHNLGARDVFGGWANCPEEREYHPEEYEDTCCVPGSGPICETWYSSNPGKGLDAETLKGLKGKKVVPVYPKDGDCGTITHKYKKSGSSCCEDVVYMSADPLNPTTITPGGTASLHVLDGREIGRELWEWTCSGGLVFKNGQKKILGERRQSVFANSSLCPNQNVRVDDGCSILDMPLSSSSLDMFFPEDVDIVIAPGDKFGIGIEGGVPPYQWVGRGGITAIGTQGLSSMVFEADEDFCGMGSFIVTDNCGDSLEKEVRSTAGRWVLKSSDPCSCAVTDGSVTWYRQVLINAAEVVSGGKKCVYQITSGTPNAFQLDCDHEPPECGVGPYPELPEESCLDRNNFPNSEGRYVWESPCCKDTYNYPPNYYYSMSGSVSQGYYEWECV